MARLLSFRFLWSPWLGNLEEHLVCGLTSQNWEDCVRFLVDACIVTVIGFIGSPFVGCVWFPFQ